MRAYGATSWAEVAEVIQGRTNDQCRDRWQDNLNPTLAKGKWTAEEDQLLWDAVASLGVSNWKLVSEQMANGRTDNNVSISALFSTVSHSFFLVFPTVSDASR